MFLIRSVCDFLPKCLGLGPALTKWLMVHANSSIHPRTFREFSTRLGLGLRSCFKNKKKGFKDTETPSGIYCRLGTSMRFAKYRNNLEID